MTTRYRGTLDLEKVVDRLPGSVRAQARAGIQKLIAQSGQRFFPIEVWIDAQHRVRRFDMSFTIGAGAQGGTLAMAVELFDYGPTPAVQAPPPAETYDLTQKALGAIGQG
jgi:hypothetical protein